MDLGLTGRAALVTGASTGLGRAVAERLAREGADVVVAARSPAPLEAVAAEIARDTGRRVAPFAGDVRAPEFCKGAVEHAVAQFGRLDVLVANAGGPPPGDAEDFGPEAYRDALELNLMSTVQLVLAAIPHMRKNRWGRIVAITSVSVKQPIPGLVLSNTARPGVVGFVKSLSRELASDGILCNVAAPGYVATDRLTSLFAARAEAEGATTEAIREKVASGVPLGRIGEPAEFAAAVAFLASEAASYVTGHTLQIDGGLVQGLL